MSDINCPYCSKAIDICHDDGYGYEEDEKYQQTCSCCDKTFIYTASVAIYYDAEKADCLNGGEHNFKETTTLPRCFRKLECSMCGEEREIEGIEEERKAYMKGLMA